MFAKLGLVLLLLIIQLITYPEIGNATPSDKTPFRLYSNQQDDIELSETLSILANIYRDLFERINVPLEIVSMPAKRAIIDAEDGKVDGQFGRVYQYQNIYPNQIRINVPVAKVTFMAFARKGAEFHIDDGWDGLIGKGLYVEYQRGILACETNLMGRIPLRQLSAATTAT